MRALRRFTRTALVVSAAQWAWQHRDDIKRELQPVIQQGQAFLREQQAKRTGKPVVVAVVEHPTASTYDVRRDAALVG